MLSDNLPLPGSPRNRKKGYPPEDLHGKSRIRGRYLNLTSYPAFASNESEIRFFEMIPDMQCNKSPSDEL